MLHFAQSPALRCLPDRHGLMRQPEGAQEHSGVSA
jgi:hypothetical protein